MFSRYNILNIHCIVILFLVYFDHPVSTLLCYDCVSTFPGSNVCLPPCSQTDRANSTCLLTRNIPLEPSVSGSLRAGHIGNEPILADATEKYFVYGEEAVYQNPSVAVGWDWEYGPITYGCDTPGCNQPQNVNRLPNALNARIPNDTLTRLLTGALDSSCYVCDVCLGEEVVGTDMADCGLTACPQHACNFVATRSSTTSPSQCDGGWHFTSGCILSREPAQVDMTLMHYIRSQTTILYQMEAVCLSDNCNNFTTFKQLKDAITVQPDLSCLLNNASTTTPSSSTTSGTGTTVSTSTSSGTPMTTTSSGGGGTTTTSSGGTLPPTTQVPGSAEQILLNTKMFILTILSFYLIKFQQ